MSIFADLFHRRVYRTAAIYAAVAWGLTEAVTVIADRLGFPDWVATVIVIAFLVGFPIVVYLAWVFQITPEGIRRTKPGSVQGGMAIALSAILLAVGTGLLFWLIYPGKPSQQPLPEPISLAGDTIAVLPFINAAGDDEIDYYAQGVAETLLAQLSQVAALRVIARDSSFALPSGMDARTKARRVNAGYLLDGSVQRAGNSLRIIARLIDGETGQYAWSKTYDGHVSDVFDIQDRISAAIVDYLRLALSTDIAVVTGRRVTLSETAYDQYLRGLFQFNIRSPEGLEQAITHFDAAIEADPEMGLAYVGRAISQATLSGTHFFLDPDLTTDPIRNDWHDYLYPTEVRATAQELAKTVGADVHRAMELAPRLAEAFTASGLLNLRTREFERAELDLTQAIELNPSYALGRHMLGLLYMETDRLDEAVKQLDAALTLDPLSTTLHLDLAVALGVNAGNAERSVAQFQTLHGLVNNDIWFDIRHVLLRLGRPAEWAALALRAGRETNMVSPFDLQGMYFFWGFAYPRYFLGDVAGAERVSEENLNADCKPCYRDQKYFWTEQQIEEIGRQAVYKLDEQHSSWWVFLFMPHTGEFEQGYSRLKEVIASAPDNVRVSPAAYSFAARYALALGDCQSAVSYFELAAQDLHPEDWPYTRNFLDWLMPYVDALDYAMALQCVGTPSRATELIDGTAEWLNRIEADGYWAPQAPVVRAKIHALRGESDLAMALLESYADSPGPVLQGIRNDPVFADISGNPRFIAAIEKIMADNVSALEEIDRLEAEYREFYPR